MIPDDVVEEVRARADIVDVLSDFVPDLKKSGKDYKAKCPFHEDRTPSFYVVPAKGFYKCFGCGESGDVFTFVMKKAGLDFVEAVKYVGGRCGVEVREVRKSQVEEDPLRPLYEANAFARDWFSTQLWESPGGSRARSYLESRGVDRETAERFGLGFAPDEWRGLKDAAAKHEIPESRLLEVGLLTTSERSPESYDRFRDRLIFPIESTSGRVVAFGGRILGGESKGAPKYLNSPETPIYHKGEILYGLSWARHAIRREECVLVMEGYMDVVSTSAAGFENVVATLGTAMTPEHARLLKRYSSQAFLLFDNDSAGQRATFKAGDILLHAGIHPSVVTLPTGEDPDSVARSGGMEGLREYVDQALDIMDRKLQILEERDFFSSIDGIRRALDGLLPTIRSTADPALRDIYISKVSDRTGVRRETLEEEVRAAEATARQPAARSPGRRGVPGGTVRGVKTGSGLSLSGLGPERQVILLLVKDRTWIERAAERLGPTDLVDPSFRVIFEALVEDPDLHRAPEGMDPASAAVLEQFLASDEELGHGGRVFEDSVTRIRQESLGRQIAGLRDRIRTEAVDSRRVELEEEMAALEKERRALGGSWAASLRTMRKHRTIGHEPSDG